MYVCKSVRKTIIANSKKAKHNNREATQMSISSRMDKYIVALEYHTMVKMNNIQLHRESVKI